MRRAWESRDGTIGICIPTRQTPYPSFCGTVTDGCARQIATKASAAADYPMGRVALASPKLRLCDLAVEMLLTRRATTSPGSTSRYGTISGTEATQKKNAPACTLW